MHTLRNLGRSVPASLRLLLVAALAALVLLTAGGAAARSGTAPDLVEVVVTLPQPSLAVAVARSRNLFAVTTRDAHLDVRRPASVAYLRSLAAAQRRLQARIERVIPQARVHWHYGVVLDGIAVVVPRSQLGRLAAVRGATVWPTVTYHALGGRSQEVLGASPQLIGAPTIWGQNLATAGQGLKIGIIDDGLDRTHPFFNPAGFSYPAGYPLGNTQFTTPKVIVARAFPSPSTTWKYADRPFDPVYSEHATHVAGIAAGDYNTLASGPGGPLRISGVAPKAYLGNYKALTVPTKDYGLDGNSPEIAKAIDQAVADGMDVINLSIGEPEVAPDRDIVVKALDAAADANVVPVVAAGNDFTNAGRGSVGSPANAPQAISVAASTEGDGQPADEIASFSSGGPTPVSLEMKPDVTAPGVNILSSIPHDSWDVWDGTSMATPHVSGAAALLRQRHPTWTVEQIKSALESTGDAVHVPGTQVEVSALREGGGRIDLPRADDPLVFTQPTSLSFGLVRRGTVGTQQIVVSDAGGGLDPWTVTVAPQTMPAGATLVPGAGTVVPGSTLSVTLEVAADAAEGGASGFLKLTRGSDVRRIPYWFRVEVPKLPADPHRTLVKPGLYHGDTAGKPSRVSTYRYPERGVAPGVPLDLSGPEQVFQFVLSKPVANFGVVVLTHGKGVRVSPRLVEGRDENRLVGYPGLPVAINPYQGVEHPVPAVGAVLPDPGTYDVVFDTPRGGKPGPFLFRFWINDTTPPTVKLLDRTVTHGEPIRLAVADSGSGVDPSSIRASVDGTQVPFSYAHGVVSLQTTPLSIRTHKVQLTVADYQETKNMEDVGPVLPNTRVFTTTVRVAP